MRLSKWRSLPIHFIDTSVVLGAFSEEEEFYEECKAYLNKVGYRYRGFLSTSVTGEIFMIIEKWENSLDRHLFFDFFDRVIFRRKIDFVPSKFEAFDAIKQIRNLDYFVEPLDSEHLAAAISEDAEIFVTLDTSLILNKNLQNILGIKVIHPKRI